MFNGVLRVVFLAVFLSFVLPAFGWDETGHKITAYIAWQQMTPDVRDRVIKILRSAPEDSQLATFYMSYGSQSEDARKREFFMMAATWADIIKDRGFQTRESKYDHSDWHYHDTLWTVKDGKVEFLKVPEEGNKLMEKLAEFDKLIRSSAPNSDKALAIAWLEHLIGDLHQPLHATGRVSDEDPKGDQGGNKFYISARGSGRPLKLHAFWDEVIGQNIPNTSDLCESDYLGPIAQSIMKTYPYSALQNRIARDKYDVWEKESVDIATTEVYKGITRNQPPPEEYKKRALKIGEERMALAGYRMGELFNEVFGTPTAGPVVPLKQ